MTDPTPPTPDQSLLDQMLDRLRERIAALPFKRSGLPSHIIALGLIAATPLLSAITAQVIAMIQDHKNGISAAAAGPKLAVIKDRELLVIARAKIAPLLTRPTVTDMAGRLTAALPEAAHVHAIDISRAGIIRIEIDCNDPDALRPALKEDILLRRLRIAGQVSAENGVTMILSSASS